MTFEKTWKRILDEEQPLILARVSIAEKEGDFKKAIKILEGYLQRHPYANELNKHLGQLYFDQNDLKNAGRRWYFVENKNENQLKSIDEFERKYGYDPLLILRKLMQGLQAEHIAFADIFGRNYKLQLLDKYTTLELKRLIKLTIQKHKIVPHFIKDFIEINKNYKIGSS